MSFSRAQRGYTLLFAVLTAVLVLGVAVFILSVSRKQYQLASAARESTSAIYAAQSAIECSALAYGEGRLSTANNAVLSCNGTTRTSAWTDMTAAELADIGLDSGKRTASMAYPLMPSTASTGSCSVVTAYEGLSSSDYVTVIIARGYNLGSKTGGAVTCPSVSSRTVERAIRLTYQ